MKHRQFVVLVLVFGLLAGSGAQAQTELLRNPGFESISPCLYGQGDLPDDWLYGSGTAPGADTYSDGLDGSAVCGLNPGDFGHFPGVAAFDGHRWVAGADWPIAPAAEALSQLLDQPLVPGSAYVVSGQVIRSQSLVGSGTYQFWLGLGASFETDAVYLGEWDETSNASAWQERDAVFIAPPEADTHLYFILRPHVTGADVTYIGLDAVSLMPFEDGSREFVSRNDALPSGGSGSLADDILIQGTVGQGFHSMPAENPEFRVDPGFQRLEEQQP